tara:strand:+ start:2460 stop:3335 length:876 start_codon:yes stop_codon:yes gene_type:complete
MKLTRQKLRHEILKVLLAETRFRQMGKSKYRNLDNYIKQADFMNKNAGGGDFEFDDDIDEDDDEDIEFEGGLSFHTDASQQLRDDLNNYFSTNMGNTPLSTEIIVDDTLTTSSDDRVIKAANYVFLDGKHNINLTIAQLEDGKTFKDFFGESGIATISQVLRHELLHMNQFLKYSKGQPTNELFAEFVREYGDAKEKGWEDEPYHTFDRGFSEREAFSHQIADELFYRVGPYFAVKILSRKEIPHDDLMQLSQSYVDVTEDLEDYDTEAIRDLLSRSLKYVKDMERSHRDI